MITCANHRVYGRKGESLCRTHGAPTSRRGGILGTGYRGCTYNEPCVRKNSLSITKSVEGRGGRRLLCSHQISQIVTICVLFLVVCGRTETTSHNVERKLETNNRQLPTIRINVIAGVENDDFHSVGLDQSAIQSRPAATMFGQVGLTSHQPDAELNSFHGTTCLKEVRSASILDDEEEVHDYDSWRYCNAILGEARLQRVLRIPTGALLRCERTASDSTPVEEGCNTIKAMLIFLYFSVKATIYALSWSVVRCSYLFFTPSLVVCSSVSSCSSILFVIALLAAEVVWATSSKVRNRIMHALVGNTISERVKSDTRRSAELAVLTASTGGRDAVRWGEFSLNPDSLPTQFFSPPKSRLYEHSQINGHRAPIYEDTNINGVWSVRLSYLGHVVTASGASKASAHEDASSRVLALIETSMSADQAAAHFKTELERCLENFEDAVKRAAGRYYQNLRPVSSRGAPSVPSRPPPASAPAPSREERIFTFAEVQKMLQEAGIHPNPGPKTLVTPPLQWAISSQTRNKLAHAINGNPKSSSNSPEHRPTLMPVIGVGSVLEQLGTAERMRDSAIVFADRLSSRLDSESENYRLMATASKSAVAQMDETVRNIDNTVKTVADVVNELSSAVERLSVQHNVVTSVVTFVPQEQGQAQASRHYHLPLALRWLMIETGENVCSIMATVGDVSRSWNVTSNRVGVFKLKFHLPAFHRIRLTWMGFGLARVTLIGTVTFDRTMEEDPYPDESSELFRPTEGQLDELVHSLLMHDIEENPGPPTRSPSSNYYGPLAYVAEEGEYPDPPFDESGDETQDETELGDEEVVMPQDAVQDLSDILKSSESTHATFFERILAFDLACEEQTRPCHRGRLRFEARKHQPLQKNREKKAKSPGSKEHSDSRMCKYLEGQNEAVQAILILGRRPGPDSVPEASGTSRYANFINGYRRRIDRTAMSFITGVGALHSVVELGVDSPATALSIKALSEGLSWIGSDRSQPVSTYCNNRQVRRLITQMLMISGIEPNPGPPSTDITVGDGVDDHLDVCSPPSLGQPLDWQVVGRSYVSSQLAAPVRSAPLPTCNTRYFTPIDARGQSQTPVRLPVEMSPYHIISVSSFGGPLIAETNDGALVYMTVRVTEATNLKGEINLKKTDAAIEEGVLTSGKTSIRVLPGNITPEGMRYEEVLPYYDTTLTNTSADGAGIRAAQLILARNSIHVEADVEPFIQMHQANLEVDPVATAALGGARYQIKPFNPPLASDRFGTIPAPVAGAASRNLAIDGWFHCEQQQALGRGGVLLPNLMFVTHLMFVPVALRNSCIIISNAAAREADTRLSSHIALLLALLAPGCMEYPVRTAICTVLGTGPDGYPALPRALAGGCAVELGLNSNLVSTPGTVYRYVVMPLLDLSMIRTPVAALNAAMIASAYPTVTTAAIPGAPAVGVPVMAGPGGGTAWRAFVSRHVHNLSLEELAFGLHWCEKHFIPGLFNAIHRGTAILAKLTTVPHVQVGPTAAPPAARPLFFDNAGGPFLATPAAIGQNLACGSFLTCINAPGNQPVVMARSGVFHTIRYTDPRAVTFIAGGIVTSESITSVLNHRWWYDAYVHYGVMHVGASLAAAFQRVYMFAGLPASLIATRTLGAWGGVPHTQAIADALVDFTPTGALTTPIVEWAGNYAIRMLGATTQGVKRSFLNEGHIICNADGVPLPWRIYDEAAGAYVEDYIPVTFANWALAAFARTGELVLPSYMRPLPENGPVNQIKCANRTCYSDTVMIGGAPVRRWVIELDQTGVLGQTYSLDAELPSFESLNVLRRLARLIRGYGRTDGAIAFAYSDRAGLVQQSSSAIIFYQSRAPFVGTSHPTAITANPSGRFLLECTDPISGLSQNREILRLHVADNPDVETINMALDGRTPLGIPTLTVNSRISSGNMYRLPGPRGPERRRPKSSDDDPSPGADVGKSPEPSA